jgi:SagB-type dehydrogenase family enzyme
MTPQGLLEYHQGTKHSYRSVRWGARSLDWRNQPSPLKRYRGLDVLALPAPDPTGVPCHEAVAASVRPEGDGPLTLSTISHLLFQAAGVVRTVRTPSGPLFFRTYASAGALYPIEVYLVSGDLDGLEAGVYHYAPAEHGLVRLRDGDLRGALVLGRVDPGHASLVLTAIPWRTAWKYGPRGFRHLYWDAGMMLANLLAAAAAREVSGRVLLGFVDRAVNELLAVDGRAELALCVVPLGRGTAPPAPEVRPLELQVSPIAPRPEVDPTIEAAHEALVLRSDSEVASFRAGGDPKDEPAREADASGELRRIAPATADALSGDGLEEVIRRRGSSRRQAPQPFPSGEYAAILDRALGGVPGDWSGTSPAAFVIANALEELPPGAHRYGMDGSFEAIREGDLRTESGFVCLEQRLGADAAAVTFLMADLEGAVRSLGDRGYAAAQLEAGIAAGRMYLGAYAQCLGATGITFYDDEARRLFATAREPMLCMVMGPEGARRSIIGCRRAHSG